MARLRQLRRLIQQTFFPGTIIRRKYEAFRALLECDRVCHERMARLEELYYLGKPSDFLCIRRHYERLSRALGGMVDQLLEMNPEAYVQLPDVLEQIDHAIRDTVLAEDSPDISPPYVLHLDDPLAMETQRVGGKASNLARIGKHLPLAIPSGFAVTTSAFRRFLSHNDLPSRIAEVLSRLDILSQTSLRESSAALQTFILQGEIPPDLSEAIGEALEAVFPDAPEDISLAVRSSAVGEDASLSFAGQYASILRVPPSGVLSAYREVAASKYSPEALAYRIGHGLLETETPMGVLVLEMIEARSSGVLYTRDPMSRDSGTMVLYCVRGEGEQLVSGALAPERLVFSREGGRPVLKRIERSEDSLSAGAERPEGLEVMDRGSVAALDLPLAPSEAEEVASWGLELENFFQQPQDIEWCLDAGDRLFVLQSRPLGQIEKEDRPDAVQLPKSGEAQGGPDLADSVETSAPVPSEVLLSGGETASPGVAAGRVLKQADSLEDTEIYEGSVLVLETSSPAFARLLPQVKAVVARVGSVAGHLASVARERGVPMLVNVTEDFEKLQPGREITVDADERKVYVGLAAEVLFKRRREEGPRDSPFRSRLKALLEHVSALNLTDPASPRFLPQNCRTLHDVIRFTHEKAVEEMFVLAGEGAGRVRGAKKLVSEVPISLYVLDLDGGLDAAVGDSKDVELHQIHCELVKRLWKGLTHSSVEWSTDRHHVDWQELDRISAGIFSKDSQLLSSFALVSRDYLNVNIRFGYHFVLLDCYCADEPRENRLALQFEGGGGTYEGRRLRIRFLELILRHHGFEVRIQGDMLHAGLRHLPPETLWEKIEMLGRLLGVTRLMDVRLDDEAEVKRLADEFLES